MLSFISIIDTYRGRSWFSDFDLILHMSSTGLKRVIILKSRKVNPKVFGGNPTVVGMGRGCKIPTKIKIKIFFQDSTKNFGCTSSENHITPWAGAWTQIIEVSLVPLPPQANKERPANKRFCAKMYRVFFLTGTPLKVPSTKKLI